MKELTQELKTYLMEQGAALVGCGDLSGIADGPLGRGVAVAVPIPAEVVRGIMEGPTDAYFQAFHEAERKLTGIAMRGEAFLQARGYRAYAQTAERVHEDEQWRTELPHKTVATAAGLGWIGKSCLLVTEQYGSAIRLASILTDAPLVCDIPVREPRCAGCSQCVKNCPAQALSGESWRPGLDRDRMLDNEACAAKQMELTRERTGIAEEFLCGRCFAVCPYTKRYLDWS